MHAAHRDHRPARIGVALAALLAVVPAAALAQTGGASSPNEGTTAVITGQGTVSRAPDTATVNVVIQSNEDVAADATAKNEATLAALTSALGALHIDPSDIKTTFYTTSYVPRPAATPSPGVPQPAPGYPTRFGYFVNRQVAVAVARVNDVGPVVDAATKARVTSITGVQYLLKDRSAANEAALALALADAATQAKVVAAATHMHLGGIKQIQVGQQFAGQFGSPVRMVGPGNATVLATQIAPSAVDVRATVTVTYFLKP